MLAAFGEYQAQFVLYSLFMVYMSVSFWDTNTANAPFSCLGQQIPDFHTLWDTQVDGQRTEIH